MRPQDIPPRIARLNQLANGLQKERADLNRDDRPFTRQELEAYLDGGWPGDNGLGRAAVALRGVNRRVGQEGGGLQRSATGG
jgi:hypothetical protein